MLPLPRATPEELSAMLWVDKHAPRDSKKIIGQGGAQSNANKLKVGWGVARRQATKVLT